MLVIASPVNGTSFGTRKLGRICGHICSPSQIVHGWCDLQVKGIVPFGGDSSQCMILYTCVCVTPVIWKILCMPTLGLHCNATRTSISPCRGSSHSAFTHRKEPVFCVWFQVFHNVGDGGIPQQQPYNLHCINHMQT